ncbi:MAG: sigma-70 family RNA polymerase sigma factor [Sarcina sp.]
MRSNNYIERLKAKKAEALDEVINKYANLVFKVAYSVLNERESSKECVNETFLKVWMNVDKFVSEEKNFKNWICTIAKYTAIDRLRKEKKHESNLYGDEILKEIKGEDIDIDSRLVLREAINKLDEIDRIIFIRKFYHDDKTAEIAKDLNMSENAIYLRVLRGKKLIKNMIKEENQ